MYLKSLAVAGAFLCLAVAPAHATMQAGQAKAKPAPQQQGAPNPQPSPVVAPCPAKDNDKSSVVSIVSGVAPIVTATLAILFGLLAWRFNERSIRRTARQDHV